MQRTIYLIDSENVSHHWIGNIRLKTSNDKIFVFISRYTSQVPVWLAAKLLQQYPANQIEFITCYTGTNSMDFHISVKLGQLTARASKTRYIIVSDDAGYDGMICYMNHAGFNVVRMVGLKDAVPVSPNMEPDKKYLIFFEKQKEECTKSITQNTKAKIRWGVSPKGNYLTITEKQYSKIQEKLQQFYQKFPEHLKYKELITEVLSKAVFPCVANKALIFQRLLNHYPKQNKAMSTIYRSMRQGLLAALDEIVLGQK